MGNERDHPIDVESFTKALNAPVSPCYDVLSGSGLRATLGESEGQTVHVEMYPDASVVRVRTRTEEITLASVDHVHARDGAIHVESDGETGWRRTQIWPNGAVMFYRAKKPTEGPTIPTGEVAEAASTEPVPDVVEAPTPESTEVPVGEEKQRVTLTGRIGYKPRFRTTPQGTLVGQFALAVHERQGETSWHSVLAFGDRAKRLEEAGFGKGEEVQIIGYPHERERRIPKSGETKTVVEIYAAVVRKTAAKE